MKFNSEADRRKFKEIKKALDIMGWEWVVPSKNEDGDFYRFEPWHFDEESVVFNFYCDGMTVDNFSTLYPYERLAVKLDKEYNWYYLYILNEGFTEKDLTSSLLTNSLDLWDEKHYYEVVYELYNLSL